MEPLTHLLDTHALIWAYENSPELGVQARAVLQKAAPRSLAISNFSLLEIAMLVEKGRLLISDSLETYLHQVERELVVLPLGAAEAAIAFQLKLPQGDPFDRVIVATARCHNLPLLTRDRQITKARLVKTLW